MNRLRYCCWLCLTLLLFASADAGAETYKNIDERSGWGSCDACAGFNARGASASHSMQRGISSPSLDGRSTRFSIGGTHRYANALWWTQITSSRTAVKKARNIVLDLYLYYKNRRAPQALEFAVTQYLDGRKLNFGIQCNIRTGDGPQWDVSTASGWKHTGIACPAPPTYRWNHIVMEFQRTSSNQLRYISVSLNGKKHYINRYVSPRSSGFTGMTFHYQMDGNYWMDDYSTWVDKITVRTW